MEAVIDPRSEIIGDVRIGKGTRINGPAYLRGHETAPLTIGNYCAIGYNLCIQTLTHEINRANLNIAFQNMHGFHPICGTKGPITIGHNCWIGDNVCVMSGVTIGCGAVIGAGSVVTEEIPDFAIAVGAPAKVKRLRFSQTIIEQLLEIAWWDWDDETIAKNAPLFNLDLAANPDADLHALLVK